MDTPLLQTKLYIPQPRPELVPRPHLVERLNEGLHCKLTLIAAPAGFGKTSLVSHWLHQNDERGIMNDESFDIHHSYPKGTSSFIIHHSKVAWLSLDESDSELARFLSYTIAALQKIDADLGQTVLPLLQLSEPPSIETLVTLLINDIALLKHRGILIFDDYHLIQNLEIHKTIAFLLDRLPPQLHLVFISREDPPFPLSRLRVRQQITEIRDSDLRFTKAEATTFLNKLMGLQLLPEDVAALEARTEGWIAGLQLAALSLRGRADKREFVSSFAGSHRQVIDYLSEDVLRLQDEAVQRFLLQTSILGRLNGPLCDAVTGQTNSQAMLESLEHGNLFIVPLDDERRWYRYHHLFADFLRIQLHHRQADQISELHRRAATWYEGNNLVIEAVEHALSAEDFERAGRLIEQIALTTIFGQAQWATLFKWMELLPPKQIRKRSQLSLKYAWALFTTGRWGAAEELLRDVESRLKAGQQTTETDWLLGELATIRALVAHVRGDMQRCIELACEALELLPEDNLTIRCVALLSIGEATLRSDDTPVARQTLQEAADMAQAAGNITITLFAIGNLVQLEVKEGHLQRAAKLYQQARVLGTVEGGTLLGPMGLACVQMGEVLREWNELEKAKQVLTEGIKLCRQQTGMPNFVLEGQVNLARVMLAGSDEQGAAEAMQQAENLLAELLGRGGNVRPIISVALAHRLRFWLARRNLDEAARWLTTNRISVDTDVSSGDEELSILLARVFKEQDRLDETEKLLQRLTDAVENRELPRFEIEILILRVLLLQAQGDSAQAIETLAQALVLAEPEGYVRLFVDEGEPMRRLLQKVAAGNTFSDYVSKLLAAFPISSRGEEEQGRILSPPPPRSPAPPLLSEPLNERERSILRLMAAGLSNREIAEELYLSINTIKWYASNIYGKLNVKKRAEAVDRAHELGIL